MAYQQSHEGEDAPQAEGTPAVLKSHDQSGHAPFGCLHGQGTSHGPPLSEGQQTSLVNWQHTTGGTGSKACNEPGNEYSLLAPGPGPGTARLPAPTSTGSPAHRLQAYDAYPEPAPVSCGPGVPWCHWPQLEAPASAKAATGSDSEGDPGCASYLPIFGTSTMVPPTGNAPSAHFMGVGPGYPAATCSGWGYKPEPERSAPSRSGWCGLPLAVARRDDGDASGPGRAGSGAPLWQARPPLLGPGWPQPRPQAWPQAPAWDGTWQSAAALSATPSQLRGWEWLGGGGRDGPLALAGLPVSGGATSWRQPAMDPLQWQDGQFFGGHKLGSTCQWTAATSHGGWPGMAAPIPAARSTPLPGQHQGVHHDAGYASGPPGRTTSSCQWEGGWIMEPGRVSPSPV